ncbi:UbiA family prenyltransferase [Plantactinospora sp. KBS50]|uniref:UbiA family prenyltransferase n=1 Tax=Plantactinospora sp. KBS50 TaxID=2024580 RepID=UPI000BAAA1AE|nr:UbiA family prenyltransferase [Plantactinospora sp. KBS50]ASW54861.1 hypothetical protein CIK06_12700 [Plantactinospora sp. KBS50]
MSTFAPVASRLPWTRSVALSWREARPVVQRMFQLRFLTAALLALPAARAGLDYGRIAVAAAAWLCTTWYVYLLNGLSDRVEDSGNGSTRPLAGGELAEAAARTMLAWLAAAALLLAILVGPLLVVLVLAMLALGTLYSAGPRPQKAHTGGAMAVIAAGGVVTYLAGWYAGGGGGPTPTLLVVGGAMSAWMALVGMTKDLPDVAGDRAAGRRTLPVVLGARRARLVLAVLTLAVGAGAGIAAWTLGVTPVVGVGLPVGAGIVALGLLRSDPGLPYRRFMIVQYAVHLSTIIDILQPQH